MRNLLLSIALVFTLQGQTNATESPLVEINEISQTVVKMRVISSVTPEQATEAMIAKSKEFGLLLVSRQKVHKAVRKRGGDSGHLEILQFCNPDDAARMVKLDPLYAAYMPCRIAVVEDKEGRIWLLMLNLDMLINSNSLPPDLQAIAIKINQAMLAVMTAGVTGEI